jgi:hypothetical protein
VKAVDTAFDAGLEGLLVLQRHQQERHQQRQVMSQAMGSRMRMRNVDPVKGGFYHQTGSGMGW